MLSPSVVVVSFNLAIHLFRVIAVLHIFLLTFFFITRYVLCSLSIYPIVSPFGDPGVGFAGRCTVSSSYTSGPSLSFYIFPFDHHIYSHCDQVIRFVSLTSAFMFACFHSLLADAFCLSSTVHSWLYRLLTPCRVVSRMLTYKFRIQL